MILALIDEAVRAGARLRPACETLGLTARTLQRWRAPGGGQDARQGPKSPPPNKLTAEEREQLLALVNAPEYRDLSPHQIVPQLADQGTYLASESTLYRYLAAEALLAHRSPSRPPSPRPQEQSATGPGQVLSWDITYLPGPVRGRFFYLYLFLDVWSRKILGAGVFEEESAEHAAELFLELCERHALRAGPVVLHADNGSPMKGATLLATLHSLGVRASFSRPRVSDDNPFSEALFRTLKYRPHYPVEAFADLQHARQWVEGFVLWYNTEHRHSALRFVTPDERHDGREAEILARRQAVYAAAKRQHPRRWGSRATRNWEPVQTVRLNPEKRQIA